MAKMKKQFQNRLFISLLFLVVIQLAYAQPTVKYKNQKLSIDERAQDLVAKMTLDEKISLLGYNSAAIPRLGIPAYNWWNEALHGVARAGTATIFPQSIGLAATFNDELIGKVANVISTEARAKYNLAIAKDRHLQYMGLTFWSPNINIFRDPRWGRGHETYGEDPYLTAQMGIAFVKGMQGNDPVHLKTAATAKHFAVHSGPEGERDKFDAIVDEKDLRETYLYAFQKLVGAGVESVMSAYNSINGVPSSINSKLLDTILRKEWGFKGHVVTDCGALDGVFESHHATTSNVATAAAAIKAGINLDCSSILQKDVKMAVEQKLISEKEIDASLEKLLKTQFKLGFYDNPLKSPFANYNVDSIHNNAHIELSEKVAAQSMVLLKNKNNLLPFTKDKYESIMIVGPNATSYDALIGNYHGLSNKAVNFVEGIANAMDPATRIEYDLGCDYNDTTHFGGIWAAGNAKLTIAVMGLSPVLEGEAGDAFLSKSGGDKNNISLPESEIIYLRKLRESVKTPIIVVITAGSNVDVASIESYADAIIYAWYPGEQGGNALANILLGKISPSGRLPITFYKSVHDLPDYKNYAMKGRTYRYYAGEVVYPFGYGLSYSTFEYAKTNSNKSRYSAKDTITIATTITNTGSMDAAEVIQAYIEYPNLERMPLKELKYFKRIEIKKGASQNAIVNIPVSELKKWDLKLNKWVLYPGKYKMMLGSNARDAKTFIPFEIN
jgi:beta-glucosidase